MQMNLTNIICISSSVNLKVIPFRVSVNYPFFYHYYHGNCSEWSVIIWWTLSLGQNLENNQNSAWLCWWDSLLTHFRIISLCVENLSLCHMLHSGSKSCPVTSLNYGNIWFMKWMDSDKVVMYTGAISLPHCQKDSKISVISFVDYQHFTSIGYINVIYRSFYTMLSNLIDTNINILWYQYLLLSQWTYKNVKVII